MSRPVRCESQLLLSTHVTASKSGCRNLQSFRLLTYSKQQGQVNRIFTLQAKQSSLHVATSWYCASDRDSVYKQRAYMLCTGKSGRIEARPAEMLTQARRS